MLYICIPSYNEAPTVGVLLWATAPIGGLLGAVLGDVFGVRAVLALVAILTCVIAAVLLLPSREDLEVHVERSPVQ